MAYLSDRLSLAIHDRRLDLAAPGNRPFPADPDRQESHDHLSGPLVLQAQVDPVHLSVHLGRCSQVGLAHLSHLR